MNKRSRPSPRQRFKKISLQTLLLIPLVGLTALAVALVGYLSYRNGQRSVNQVAQQLRYEINARIGEHLRAFLEPPKRINQTNAQLLGRGTVDLLDQVALERHFWEQVQLFDTVTSINFGNTAGGLANAGREGAGGSLYLIGTDGFESGPFRKYAAGPGGDRAQVLETIPDFDARTRSWYRNAVQQGGEVWSDVYPLFTGQDLSLSVSRPVYDDQDEFLGVTAVNLFLSHLADFLAGIDLGRTGQSFLMERSGLLLAASTGERPFTGGGEGHSPERIQAGESAVPLTRSAARDLSEQRDLLAAYPFEFHLDRQRQFGQVTPFRDPAGLDWLIVTVLPERDFMAQINAHRRTTLVLMTVTLLVILGTGLFITRRIIRPIGRLNQAADQLARGQWQDTGQPATRIGELDALSRSFDHMAGRWQEMLGGLNREIGERKQAEEELRESERKLDYFFSQSLDGCFFMMLDEPVAWHEADDREQTLDYIMTHQRMTKVNQVLLDQYRAREEEFLELTPYDLFRHDLEHGRYIWRGLFDKGRWHVETNERRLDGTLMLVEGDYICLYDSAGRITGHFGVQADVTEEKAVQEALRRSEEKYRRIVTNIEDILYSVDAESREFSYLSPSFEKVLGYTPEDIQRMGGRPAFMSIILQGNAFSGQTKLLDSLQSRKAEENPFHSEAWWRCRDGTLKYLEDIWTPVYQNGVLVSTEGVLRDITVRKKTEEEIRYMSYHDTLTGLYNRTFLDAEMARLDTGRQLPLTVIMADLNGLKLVNDTYGHQQGDLLLNSAAGILKTCCREEDIIARWGGDEFVILLPQTTAWVAGSICQRITHLCAQTSVDQVPVSMALGLATRANRDKKITELIKEAEDKMYQQKLTESRSTKSAVLRALLKTLATKSYETEVHTRRMQEIARKIGQKLNLPDSDLSRLDLVITLHDIGKINLPEKVLTKKGTLTAKEWKMIRQHPEIGYRIARATEDFTHVAEDILSHHERWDGTGYPRKLPGGRIPLLARITAVADAWEVMSNGRPYKEAMVKSEIIAEFKKEAGRQFDPDLVEAFLSVMKEENDL